MWPMLFGSGWIWGALVAAALTCFIVGVLGFLFLITVRPARPTSDEFDELWHQYEEGDLTRPEFERTIRERSLGRRTRRGQVNSEAVGGGL
jgi:hypothetical protein